MKTFETSFGSSNIIVNPLSSHCFNSFESKEHVCIGISPFNSLFSESYISALIQWGLKNFNSLSLFVPDEPTYYTLEALGYSDEECRRKMKKQLNWLRNKISKALLNNGINHQEDVLNWDKLSNNKFFKEELDTVYSLFDTDESFRKECLKASKWVLQNKLEDKELTEQILLKAVKYFLAEIPMFSATNKIVEKTSSLFCYHQSIGFHELLYNNHLKLKPHSGQGYGIIST